MSAEALAAWVGVAITLAISIVSLVLSVRSARRSSADHELDVQRELTRQASQISAWIAFRFSLEEDVETPRGNHLVLSNASSDAIYDVRVTALMKNRPYEFSARICPPGVYLAEWRGHSRTERPWGLLSDLAEVDRSGDLLRPFTVSGHWRVTRVVFTDSTGTPWERSEAEGIRRQLSAEGAPA